MNLQRLKTGSLGAHEQGLTGMDVTTWTAIFLPKRAPRAIVDKLKDATQATMETPLICGG